MDRKRLLQKWAAWGHVRRADAYVYPSGLVAYYSMDSRSTNDVTVYDTFGSNDGTTGGDISFAEAYGVRDAGADFDGNGDYIDMGQCDFLDNTQGTVSFWVYNNGADLGSPFTAADDTKTRRYIILYLRNRDDATDPSLQFIHYDEGYTYELQTPKDSIPLNEWSHVVITSDSLTIKIYVNAVEQTLNVNFGTNDGSWFQDLTGVNNFVLGGLIRSTGFSQDFDGHIDEFQVYNRALAETEVTTLYDYNKTGAGH